MPFTVHELPVYAVFYEDQIFKHDGAHCPFCNGPLKDSGPGSCGGRGKRMECTQSQCGLIFTKASGGARASDDGELWETARCCA